jgi:hypothetical protein
LIEVSGGGLRIPGRGDLRLGRGTSMEQTGAEARRQNPYAQLGHLDEDRLHR